MVSWFHSHKLADLICSQIKTVLILVIKWRRFCLRPQLFLIHLKGT